MSGGHAGVAHFGEDFQSGHDDRGIHVGISIAFLRIGISTFGAGRSPTKASMAARRTVRSLSSNKLARPSTTDWLESPISCKRVGGVTAHHGVGTFQRGGKCGRRHLWRLGRWRLAPWRRAIAVRCLPPFRALMSAGTAAFAPGPISIRSSMACICALESLPERALMASSTLAASALATTSKKQPANYRRTGAHVRLPEKILCAKLANYAV